MIEKIKAFFRDWKFKKDKKAVESFTSDELNLKKAQELAYQIQQSIPGWFKVIDIVKKFKVSQPVAAEKLEFLILFKLCATKVKNNVLYLKIDVNQNVQRDLLRREVALREVDLAALKEKLAALETK
jgi:hypothetical protein